MSAPGRSILLLLTFLAGAAASQADQVLVLEDGRRITVTALVRRGDRVRFQTASGQVFEVRADQVVEPPLSTIPEAAAAPPAAPPASGPATLVLTDGRRIEVSRLERRGDRVRFQTTSGQVFEVPADRVAAPPLETIPAAGQAPGAPGVRVQTLVLQDGRRLQVQRLARRGGQVIFQTVRGEGFAVPEDQVVEPLLSAIPSLDTPVATAEAAPEEPARPILPDVPVREPSPAGPEVADFATIADRWSIAYPPYPGRNVSGRPIDPYNQNRLKGDRPVIGDSVFLVLSAVLDTPVERRRLPVGSGVSAASPGRAEFFGDGAQSFLTPRLFVGFELFQGDTAFRPKSWAVKLTGAYNLNYLRAREANLVNIDVREGKTRTTDHFSLEEAYGEVKLADLSRYYDSVSVRAGIQPFVSDFRGFVFSDSNLGARLFGNLDENRWQYNLAYFDLLEKDTNSELNTFDRREQRVWVANLYRQDFLTPGYSIQASYHRSLDHASEDKHYDQNGFQVRPARIGSQRLHDVETSYLGVAGDGHVGRLNLSHAYYYVFGEDGDNPIAGQATDVRAHMAAIELSVDRDWARFRTSFFFASGDSDPGDGTATGFDSIYDFSNFAGGPFSFWSRSAIPLTQTSVFLKSVGSLVPDLRSNKFEGQANHVNPGVLIFNGGVDLDLTPKLKAVANASFIRFHHTEPLEELLFQPDIPSNVGLDLGAGVVFRPDLNENIVVTGGVTGLLPAAGFDALYSSVCSVPGCGADSQSLFNVFLDVRLAF